MEDISEEQTQKTLATFKAQLDAALEQFESSTTHILANRDDKNTASDIIQIYHHCTGFLNNCYNMLNEACYAFNTNQIPLEAWNTMLAMLSAYQSSVTSAYLNLFKPAEDKSAETKGE
jgi:hypothetical protein